MCSPHTRGCTGSGQRRDQRRLVFPAHAGLYRRSTARPPTSTCVPRTRGAVPKSAARTPRMSMCSPHTRGCTGTAGDGRSGVEVFPAHAGLYRIANWIGCWCCGVPRTRGAVPERRWLRGGKVPCSPHTRGCTEGGRAQDPGGYVFPAHAGLYRSRSSSRSIMRRVPRTRGAVPETRDAPNAVKGCSPHTRGCTDWGPSDKVVSGVFPAHAGLYRNAALRRLFGAGVPRTRGAVPSVSEAYLLRKGCSPHTRGCTGAREPGGAPTDRVPRTRGAVPEAKPVYLQYTGCSPHTRGCTETGRRRPGIRGVFPAHAGLYPRRPARCRATGGVPRTRGAVPLNHVRCVALIECSPHTRGCTEENAVHEPALQRVPRTRGAVPTDVSLGTSSLTCSPHTRGCTVRAVESVASGQVFPAHAGLYRRVEARPQVV